MITVTIDIRRRGKKKQYTVTLKGQKAEPVERILLAADRKDSPQKPQEIIEEVLLGGLRSVISARDVTC